MDGSTRTVLHAKTGCGTEVHFASETEVSFVRLMNACRRASAHYIAFVFAHHNHGEYSVTDIYGI